MIVPHRHWTAGACRRPVWTHELGWADQRSRSSPETSTVSQMHRPQMERPGSPRLTERWPAETGTQAGSSWSGQPSGTPEVNQMRVRYQYRTESRETTTKVSNHQRLWENYLRRTLTPTREGVEEANAGWGHQKQNKDYVVHHGEVHLDHLPHGDAGCWRRQGLWGPSQEQPQGLIMTSETALCPWTCSLKARGK